MVDDAERFSDESDRATYIEQQANDEAVDHHRRLAAPEQVKDENGNWPHTDCVECGDTIHPKRLEMGKVRCVYCQHIKESQSRQYMK